MDFKSLMSEFLTKENLAKVTEKTGLELTEVKGVLGKAMPFIANADNKEKGEEEAVRAIADEAGVSDGDTKSILGSALPILMSLMGGGLGGGLGGGQGQDLTLESGPAPTAAVAAAEDTVSAAGGDMFGMLSGLLGGMDTGGMDMSDLFGSMFGGQGQELTLESGPAPTPAQAAAPTIEQAFTQANQAAEQAQEEVQQESAGGLLGLLSGLFRKK